MATFQKRNGRVTATVRIKPHPPKTKTFDTLRDAKAWSQAIEVQFKNEKAQNFEHILLKDALVEYRDTSSVLKKGAKQEVTRINYMLKYMDCNRSILSVDKQFLVAWREWRLENTKGSTVRRELLMLAGFFTWCVETKLWLAKNPVKEVKLPSVSPHRERVISEDEIEILLPFLNDELKDIFLFALETGMRQSEICNLTWNRVFLDKKYLLLEVTKNGRKREVPLSKIALDLLKGRKSKNKIKVFSYLPKYVSADFMKSRVEAGLLDFTFHDARHTAATRIALKIQVLDLCKMFGWTDPKRAMIYYNPTASEIAERL